MSKIWQTTGEGNVNPLQYSCLEDFTDRGAWWATVHEVTKGQPRLSTSVQYMVNYKVAL